MTDFKIYRDDDIFQFLFTQNLQVGSLFYPNTDGTSGQAIITNGAGQLSFATVGDVTNGGTSTDKAVVRWNGTTGKIIQNSTATLSDSGLLSISNLQLGTLTYPSIDGTSGQVISTNGAGILSFISVGTGNVGGPGSSTNNAIVRWNGATGTLIKDSTATLSNVGLLTISDLTVGSLQYPSIDGTSGQVISTNGTGVLSFLTPVSGPVSSTDNNLVRWNGTTGKILKNSTTSLTDAGLLTTSNLTVGSLQYPSVDGTSGQVITTNGSGVLSLTTLVSASETYGRRIVNQTTNLSVGDHIIFDTNLFTTGSLISLDTTSPYSSATNTASIGRITLTGGHTYYLEAWIIQFSATTLDVAWYNSDTNTLIDGPTGNGIMGTLTVFTPAINTRVEVRITSSLLATAIARSFVKARSLN